MKIGSMQQAVGNSKKTKIFGFALCTLLYALCESAETQQSKKVPRVGFLEGASIVESQGIEHSGRDFGNRVILKDKTSLLKFELWKVSPSAFQI